MAGLSVACGEVSDGPWRLATRLEPAHQQLEGRIGGFVRIAAVLELLEVLDQPPGLRVVAVELETELARLGQHVAATRQLRDEHPGLVSHDRRVDVLVRVLVAQHASDALAPLVGESAITDKWLL